MGWRIFSLLGVCSVMPRASQIASLAVRFLLVVGGGLLLGGCETRQATWLRLTDSTVTFFAPAACSGSPASLTVTGPYSLLRSFQWEGGLSDWMDDPKLKQRFPGDYYAYTLTIIDAAGQDRQIKAFLLTATDLTNKIFQVPYVGTGPHTLEYYRVAPPFTPAAGKVTIPVPTSISLCGYLSRMPWSTSSNAPYWMPPELFDPTIQKQYETTILFANAAIYGFVVLAVLGLFFLPFGYFDVDNDREKAEARNRALIRYILAAPIATYILFGLQNSMQPALDELLNGKAYYAFYNSLPRSRGVLLPVSYVAFQRLSSGPPTPDSMQQPTLAFWLIYFGSLIAGLMVFGAPIYKGWYWLSVPLPLEVRFNRAMARGRWPTAEQLIQAVREGTFGKNAWQSKAMELKATRFEAKLHKKRNKLERAYR